MKRTSKKETPGETGVGDTSHAVAPPPDGKTADAGHSWAIVCLACEPGTLAKDDLETYARSRGLQVSDKLHLPEQKEYPSAADGAKTKRELVLVGTYDGANGPPLARSGRRLHLERRITAMWALVPRQKSATQPPKPKAQPEPKKPAEKPAEKPELATPAKGRSWLGQAWEEFKGG